MKYKAMKNKKSIKRLICIATAAIMFNLCIVQSASVFAAVEDGDQNVETQITNEQLNEQANANENADTAGTEANADATADNADAEAAETTDQAAATTDQTNKNLRVKTQGTEYKIKYKMNTAANATFVPEIVGLEEDTEAFTADEETAEYEIRGLNKEYYQTQTSPTSHIISYQFMGWKTEYGTVVKAADKADLMADKKQFDKNNDKVVTLTAQWTSKYNFNKTGCQRYVLFSLYTEGAAPQGIDNNAKHYMDGMYGTIALPGDLTEAPMKNFLKKEEGRVLINNVTNDMGVDQADKMIRNMTNEGISNYLDPKNGNEEDGYAEYIITLLDFPEDADVIAKIRTQIENGRQIKVNVDGTDKKITKDENFEDFDADHYTIKWYSVKLQSNGWHVDGVVVPKAVEEAVEEDIDEEALIEDETDEIIDDTDEIIDEETNDTAVDTEETNFEDGYVLDEGMKEDAELFVRIIDFIEDELTEETEQDAEEATEAQADVKAEAKTAAAVAAKEVANKAAANLTASTNAAAPAAATTIDETDVPMAAPQTEGSTNDGDWALLNLIAMMTTVLLSLMTGIFFANGRRNGILTLLGLIPAVTAAVVFFLNGNIGGSMVMTDGWTIVFAGILGAEILTAILAIEKKDKEEA